MMIEDESIGEVILLSELPTDSSFQGTALRPDGRVLASRLDLPELYQFDPKNPEAPPQLIYTFPDTGGLVQICPLKGCHDEYAVVSGTLDVAKFEFSRPLIWRIALSSNDDEPPKVTLITEMKGAGFPASCWSATERTLLVPDSGLACIFRIDVQDGRCDKLIEDDEMGAAIADESAEQEDFYGINGIYLIGEWAYFANESRGTLCRFPVSYGRRTDDDEEPDDGWDIHATGDVKVITDEIPHSDALVFTNDPNVGYSANYVNGHLRRIDIDPVTGAGEVRNVLENLVTPVSVELVYPEDGSKPKMIILCTGEIDISWVRDHEGWSDIANINASVTVTVTTTEEVVEVA